MDTQQSLPTRRNFAFFGTLLIVVGIAVTVFLSRQGQDIRNRAQGESMDFVNAAGTSLGGSTNSQTVRVKLIYNPSGANTSPTNTPVPGAPTSTPTPTPVPGAPTATPIPSASAQCAPNENNCVSGTVTAVTSLSPIAATALANVPVTLSGPTSQTINTNANGTFKFSTVQQGSYSLSVPAMFGAYNLYIRTICAYDSIGQCNPVPNQPTAVNQGTFTISATSSRIGALFIFAFPSVISTPTPTLPANSGNSSIGWTVTTSFGGGPGGVTTGAQVYLTPGNICNQNASNTITQGSYIGSFSSNIFYNLSAGTYCIGVVPPANSYPCTYPQNQIVVVPPDQNVILNISCP